MKKLILSLFLALILTPPRAGAVEKVLYPNANGSTGYQDLAAKSAGNHYVEVDESDSAPDTGTYVYGVTPSGGATKEETENMEDCGSLVNGDSIPDNAVFDSVKVHNRTKVSTVSTDAPMTILWYNGTTAVDVTNITLSLTYVDNYEKRTTNLTGGTWTKANINALQCGWKIYSYEAISATVTGTLTNLHIFYHLPSTAQRSRTIIKDTEDTKGLTEGGLIR